MKKDDLDTLSKGLNKIYENLKAEIIIAQLQKNTSLESSNVVINNQSTFRRAHRRDILEAKVKNDTLLEVLLSRNGVYDQLPEGMFHSPSAAKNNKSYSGIRKTYKKEEKDARHFFSPLENEFFQQTLNIEVNEQELLNNFLNLDNNFLYIFWKIEKEIPQNYLLKLLKLIPYSYKIAGNIKLTELCLKKILDKNVSIKKIYVNNVAPSNNLNSNLILGLDFSLANSESRVCNPTYEVTIGPIEENEIDDFINEKSGVKKLITIFYDYFAPLEMDIKTKLTVNHTNGFSLSTNTQPVMGISTLI